MVIETQTTKYKAFIIVILAELDPIIFIFNYS
jgi:hypothetical protein